ncbi:MAG: hypothetical protein KDJ65_39350 [Anaerolineae bacterium]|nr:hypothetical protein [Anaerolineae bacterium]
MKFQGALIKEQGIKFAIVIVKKYVIDNRTQSTEAIDSFRSVFPGLPIVLMAQDYKGTPHYYGRKDIVRFLSKVPMSAIPWKEYRLN